MSVLVLIYVLYLVIGLAHVFGLRAIEVRFKVKDPMTADDAVLAMAWLFWPMFVLVESVVGFFAIVIWLFGFVGKRLRRMIHS